MLHGQYVNPGNEGFRRILRSEYVDKSGLIGLINRRIDTPEGLVCVSRPRRFGKSFAAQMLSAYYDASCDSHELFDQLEIASGADFEQYLNQYNVICLDIAGFLSAITQQHGQVREITMRITESLCKDLCSLFPYLNPEAPLTDSMIRCVEHENRKFIFIIDEWDAVIREAKRDNQTQTAYLNLLRDWFKNINFTPKVVAAAYMTGILPIKKDGSQSAISDFIEYPILYPDGFASYTGFTEKEVQTLARKHVMDFSEIKNWYDGYHFPDCGSIYNPYSVSCAIREGKCRSYWQKTSAAESLFTYINMDFDGLQEIVARLIAGEDIEVDVNSFENDFQSFKGRDDILTLLIHLGYLTYDETQKTVRIPNEEVRLEFEQTLGAQDMNAKWVDLIRNSKMLLANTISGDGQAVAEAISKLRETEYAPTFYNDEQSLRYIIKFAYIACIGQYMKVEELPSGKGIADVVYLPKHRSSLPALVIELKWNQTAGGAIEQIKERNYPAILKEYQDEIILVGINYDTKTKEHSCVIQKMI